MDWTYCTALETCSYGNLTTNCMHENFTYVKWPHLFVSMPVILLQNGFRYIYSVVGRWQLLRQKPGQICSPLVLIRNICSM